MTDYSFISADYYIDFLSNPESNFWLVTQIDLDKHINSWNFYPTVTQRWFGATHLTGVQVCEQNKFTPSWSLWSNGRENQICTEVDITKGDTCYVEEV